MAEVANYSVAPTNSDDTDWNWTRPVETDPAWSSGFHVSVIFALSVLILAGTLVNLVTVVTHLQTVYELLVIATDRNGLHQVRRGSLRYVADRCSRDASPDTADRVARQHPRHEPCLLRPSPIDRVCSAAPA